MTKFLKFCDPRNSEPPFLPLFLGALALSIGRIFDAISDPLIGEISDGTNSPLGRRRIWMVISLPLIAISFFAIWHPPTTINSHLSAFLWMFITVNIFFFAYTMFAIPYDAWLAEMAIDKNDRLSAGKYKTIFALLGIAIATPAISKQNTVEGANLALAVAIVTMIVSIFGIKEKKLSIAGSSFSMPHPFHSLKQGFQSILKNRNFLSFCLMIIFIEAGGNAFMKNLDFLIPALAKGQIISVELFYNIMLISFILSTVAGAFFWNHQSKNRSKIENLNKALIFMSGAVLFLFLVGSFTERQFVLQSSIWFVLCGFSYSAASILAMAMVGDFSDDHNALHQEQKEARYYGFYAFVRKVGLVLGALGFALVVELCDFLKLTISPYKATMIFLAILFLVGSMISRKISVKEKV